MLSDPQLLSRPINKIGEPSVVLLRRGLVLQLGGFAPELKQLVDLEMWLRVMAHAKVGFIPEPLASFRVHLDQESFKNRGSDKRSEARLFGRRIEASTVFGMLAPESQARIRQMCEGHRRAAINSLPIRIARRIWTTIRRA